MLALILILVVLNAAVHAKYVEIPSSGQWDGDDGPWATFAIDIGQPPQPLRLLPSTAGLVLAPEDATPCILLPCANQQLFFDRTKSSSWTEIGYLGAQTAALVNQWNYTAKSILGTDRLALSQNNEEILLLNSTYITSLTNITGYSLGMFGVWPRSFSAGTTTYPSLLDTLAETGTITTRSWSYTAGASPYLQQGSFVFGGVDTMRYTNVAPLTVKQNMSLPESLSVSINIIVDKMLSKNMLMTSISALISSDIAEIWLPHTACSQLESAYGLQWNSSLNLYLLNQSQSDDLNRRKPIMQFQLAPIASTDPLEAVAIDVPWNFLMQNITIANQVYTYFAIRHAADESQFVLGRTFLQAAHLVVNHDNNSFLLRPARFPGNQKAIQSIDLDLRKSTTVTPGIIAGAVVGCVLSLALVVCGIFLYRKRRAETHASGVEEQDAAPVTELLHESHKPELPADIISEPPAYRRREFSDVSVTSEVDGIDTMLTSRFECLPGISEAPEKKTPIEPDPVELEGSPAVLPELNAILSAIPDHEQETVANRGSSSRPCVSHTVSDESSVGAGVGTLMSTLSNVTEDRGRSTCVNEGPISPLHSRNVSRQR